jgi:hypothetical protein
MPMPLLDHFRPPISRRLPWRTLHGGWLAELAVRLNTILPPGFVALESVQVGGRFELDVGTYEEDEAGKAPSPTGAGGRVAVAPAVWTPPATVGSFQAVFPDAFELRVYDSDVAGTLVAAIELISPSNKDRDTERQAFAAKCAAYLAAGACVVVVDVVTTRRGNLHNDIIRLLDAPLELELPPDGRQYAAAYRPVVRASEPTIDLWTATFSVGEPLPTMPLRLTGDLFVPVEFEDTYTETCRQRRLV